MKWHKTVNCGSKINLRLKVTGRRPDGLHDLSSCFYGLDHPGDLLTVTETDAAGISLEVPGSPELSGRNNLLWKAAEAYAAAAGIEPVWHIRLEKRVPVAAGLGGGSADAGALLALLNDHYQLLAENELRQLAFSLGADVPFFLCRRAAWVTGAGENFQWLENLPSLPEILIVNPGFPVSAKWAYTHMDKALIGADDPAEKASFINGEIGNWQQFCRNDLAPAVMKKFPVLGLLENALRESGALAVQVSGSGPSLFALFAPGGAVDAAEKLKKRFGNWENLKVFAGGKEF